jgi:saccharopine dehydrogenase-like NADP-dependent oxidoreductase
MPKPIIVFGAGLVAPPLIEHLLGLGYQLTVASNDLPRARTLLGEHVRGTALAWSAETTSDAALDALLRGHHLAVSLLPAPFHPLIARACIRNGAQLVTTSYVSAQMQALDADARRAGVCLLNEIGLDPGIDHMSAMAIIDRVHGGGGRIRSFRSSCGGIPAPEDNDNPWGYKFSWSPLAVLRATNAPARYRESGQLVELEPEAVTTNASALEIAGIGALEAYANRNALDYVERYGLEQVETMYRGTLRYPGWCETIRALRRLGLLDEKPLTPQMGQTWASCLRSSLGLATTDDLEQAVTELLRPCAGNIVLARLRWLGLFSEQTPLNGSTTLEALAQCMWQRMAYHSGERDMVVMRHDLIASEADGREVEIRSELVIRGTPGGHSAMARTVGLPAAIAADLLFDPELIALKGVQIPLKPAIYRPVLHRLASLGIAMQETVTIR